MSTLEQAARQALDALEYHVAQTRRIQRTTEAIDALRNALTQQQAKPVKSVDLKDTTEYGIDKNTGKVK
jgi:hypothetical protein